MALGQVNVPGAAGMDAVEAKQAAQAAKEAAEGKIRLRAMKAPTEAITAEYWLRGGKE